MESFIELMIQGMTFAGVERFVQRRRQQYVTSHLLQLLSGTPIDIVEQLQQNPVVKLIRKPMPSNNILQHCFLANFLQNRKAYNHHMSQLKVEKFISLDHTFKVASNIGFERSDGKWITLYNSVFIAMNEHGLVVTWQFTKTTSLDEVRTQLQQLCSRMGEVCTQPITILVDACCSQRQKLQQIFGEDTIVSLDIFHAIQRVTRKMSKRHPF